MRIKLAGAMAKTDITKRPKRKVRDIPYTLLRAGISSIWGGAANELFSLVITPSLEKRRDKWIESIAQELKGLEEKIEGFKIENLAENESFVSILIKASQVAIRNHQKQKLEKIRNAVLNAALPNAPEEDLQLMFLNFVDSLTLSHLRILKLLDDYKAKQPLSKSTGKRIEFVAKSENTPAITIKEALPDLGNHKIFYDQILKDLRMRGLLEYQVKDQARLLDKIIYSQPTKLGKQLLAFISSPFTL